jgi:hypothetical protein
MRYQIVTPPKCGVLRKKEIRVNDGNIVWAGVWGKVEKKKLFLRP